MQIGLYDADWPISIKYSQESCHNGSAILVTCLILTIEWLITAIKLQPSWQKQTKKRGKHLPNINLNICSHPYVLARSYSSNIIHNSWIPSVLGLQRINKTLSILIKMFPKAQNEIKIKSVLNQHFLLYHRSLNWSEKKRTGTYDTYLKRDGERRTSELRWKADHKKSTNT